MKPLVVPALRPTPSDAGRDRWFFFTVMLWLLLFMALRPLAVPDEGRYGEVGRWMTVSGDWLIPRENGLPFFHKPPLVYWLDATFYTLFGAKPWVARLAPALAGIVASAGLFWFTRRRIGSAGARLATTVFATSLLVFGSSQYVNHDMMVACWISVALFGFIDALLTRERAPLFVAYAACALGVLSKGLIGVALPGMVLLPWLLTTGRWRQIGFLLNPWGILLFAAIVTPWFLLVQQRYPDFFHYFFIEQQFNRYTSGNFNNKQPWWFYVVLLPFLFFPWPLLAARRGAWNDARSVLGREMALLMAWWLVGITVFFTLPPSKLVGYILPASPPLALLLAASLLRQQPGRLQRILVLLFPVLLGVGLLVGARHVQHVGADDLNLIRGIGAAMVAAGILIGTQMLRAADPRPGTLLLSAICCVALVATVGIADRKNNSRDAAVGQLLTPGTQLVFYRAYWMDLPFVLQIHQQVAVVNSWSEIRTDSVAMEQLDGKRFDKAAAGALWEEQDYQRAIASGRPLLILSARTVTPPGLEGIAPTYRGQNFNAWRFSGTPSAGSVQTSSPLPAPAQ
ncbi:MAG TPA: glycosyltransferase family 39 protein [Moraxellaceae bacterium]|nr:glycosyltransferase family 39 protein [Moraxellaceae bacterium]